ncbi:MAG: hypothetical protein J6386_24705 [Candidatus Synoicihabitans palmerolidicus]|nr:hypothetical protein [Candidatus Synoicihabitans palmerolidicus]
MGAYVQTFPTTASRWAYIALHEFGWLVEESGHYQFERHPMPAIGQLYGAVTDLHGDLWVEMGIGEIARVQTAQATPRVSLYTIADGLSDSWAELSLFNGEIRVNGSAGFRHFDAERNRFEVDTLSIARHPELKSSLGRPTIDHLGRLWVSSDQRIHIIDTTTGLSANPHDSIPASIFPNYLNPQEDGIMWIAQRLRLARFDPNVPEVAPPPLRAIIARIDFPLSNRVIYSPRSLPAPLSAHDSAMTVHLQAPNAPFNHPISFEVQLGSSDSEWVSVGGTGQVSFNHLNSGNYSLRVRTVMGDQRGEDTVLPFSVLDPWHLSPWAFVFYGFVLITGIVVAIRISNYVEHRENRRL